MHDAANNLLYAALIGAGATALTDLFVLARKWVAGIALPDYTPVGRWLAHMTHGQFHHHAIAAAPRVHGERAIGWTAHYLTGIAFAYVLLAIWGVEWVRHPALGPALIIGFGSVAAPLLLMQPGMGAGIAARHTTHPNIARLRSIVMHGVFGVGLYAAGCAVSWMR